MISSDATAEPRIDCWRSQFPPSEPAVSNDVVMDRYADLFSCDLSGVEFADVLGFVDAAIDVRSHAESTVLEFKRQRDGANIVKTVAAMANSDGGLLIVGVDEETNGEIVGVPVKEVDRIVQSLRRLPSSAMPEVEWRALPDDPNQVVIVIRIDSDNVDRPVVVDGRVVVRVPGQTVGASREQIWALFSRDGADAVSRSGSVPVGVGRVGMWDDGHPEHHVDVRVHAQALLPRRALLQRWIGSSAFEAIVAFLHERAPLPKLLAPEARRHEIPMVSWEATEKASIRYRFRSSVRPSPYRGAPSVVGSVFVSLSGRLLDVVVSIGAEPRGPGEPLFVDDGVRSLRDLLLAAATMATAILTTAAVATGLDSPMSRRVLTPWLGGEGGVRAVRVPDRWSPTGPEPTSADWQWEPSSVEAFDAATVDATVVAWLSQLLFDLGATGFEDEVATWPRPDWSRTG